MGDGTDRAADHLHAAAHLWIGHLIHVKRLDHLGHAQGDQRFPQPANGLDAADADKQGIVGEKAGDIALQRPLGQISPGAGTVAGDVNPGMTAGTVGQITAGEPPVFATVTVVQPDLEPLNLTACIPDGDEKAFGAGQRPTAVAGIEAGNTVQVMAPAAQQAGQQPPGRFGLRQTAIMGNLRNH